MARMRGMMVAFWGLALPVVLWSRPAPVDLAGEFRQARAAALQSGADRVLPALPIARADELAKQAEAASAAQPNVAARLYRDAMWALPKVPSGSPAELKRILGNPTLRHSAGISTIAFDATSDRLISGSADRTVRVWNMRDGSRVFEYQGHAEPVNSVAALPNGMIASAAGKDIHLWKPNASHQPKILSGSTGIVRRIAVHPNGSQIISGGDDRVVRIWNLEQGKEPTTLGVQNVAITGVAVSKSCVAVVNQEGGLTVWNISGREPRKLLDQRVFGNNSPATDVQFAPDGNSVAVSGEKVVKIIAIPGPNESGEAPGTIRRTLEGNNAHTDLVQALAFSPDGQSLATAGKDNSVRLWDVGSGQVTRTFLGHAEEINAVAFSGTGVQLASAGMDQTIRLWDLEPVAPIAILAGHRGAVWSAVSSPDGRIVATAGADRIIRLWDRTTHKEIRSLTGHEGPITALAFTVDGRSIISTSGDRTARIWNVDGGAPRTLTSHSGPVLALAISADGRFVATGSADRTVRLWDLSTAKQAAQWPISNAAVTALAFAPDGSKLAAASADGMVRLLDATNANATTPAIAFKAHSVGGAAALAFLPGTHLLVTCGGGQVVKVWDLQSPSLKEPVFSLQGHSGAISALAVSPDGKRIASGGADAVVKIWDVAKRAEAQSFRGHKDWVGSVAFSSDGATLISASVDGKTILWRVSDHRDAELIAAHSRAVTAICSLTNGDIVTGAQDRSVIKWNLATGQPVAAMPCRGGTISIGASSDGKWILAGCGDKKVHMWDGIGEKVYRTFDSQERVPALCWLPGDQKFLAWQSIEGSDDEVTSRVQSIDIKTSRADDVFSEKGRTTGCLSFSADGSLAVVGSPDGSVRVWQLESKSLLAASFAAHTGSVIDAAITPDKKLLVSCNTEGEIKTWRVGPKPTEPVAIVNSGVKGLLGLAMSGDGSRFAAFAKDTVVVYDTTSGRLVKKLDYHPISSLAFVAGGKQLAAGLSDGTIAILDLP